MLCEDDRGGPADAGASPGHDDNAAFEGETVSHATSVLGVTPATGINAILHYTVV